MRKGSCSSSYSVYDMLFPCCENNGRILAGSIQNKSSALVKMPVCVHLQF